MTLPALGEVSYNGYTFNEKSNTTISGKPRYDRSGRTVFGVEYTIKVTTIIDADNTDTPAFDTAAEMQTIRQQLEAPGGTLRVTKKGFGDLLVNDPSDSNGVRDIDYGPKPQMIDWRPAGGSAASAIIWQCTTIIPECSAGSSPVYQGQIAEFVFTMSFDIDAGGWTTRTVSGHITIPTTRASQSDKTLQDNADNYWQQVVAKFQPLTGFRRTKLSRAIDEPKTGLDFTIVDEEMPLNIPPPGIVQVSASNTVQTAQALSQVWQGTMSATYEVAKDADRTLAFRYFWLMLINRLEFGRQHVGEDADVNQNDIIGNTLTLLGFQNNTQPSRGGYLVKSIKMTEPEIYGKQTAEFEATYLLLKVGVDNILKASGLWQPVPNSDWNQWSTSLSSGVYSSTGKSYAGLGFANSDEVIVDLCLASSVPVGGASLQTPALSDQQTFTNQCPPEDNSFMDYQLALHIEPEEGVVEMKALPLNQPQEDFSPPVDDEGYQPSFPGGEQTAVTQDRTNPSYYATLEGRALRACYEIPSPELRSVGGGEVKTANIPGENYFRSWQAGNWLGVPIIAAEWRLRWICQNVPPGSLGVPASPLGNS